jgi:hypothetical protein
MDYLPNPKRTASAHRFLAELSAVAAECALTAGVWDDELTARRRQRTDARSGGEIRGEEHQVKAL